MRILFYINRIGRGGAERVMVNLSNMFNRIGYEVHLVTSFPTSNEYPVDEGVTRHTLSQQRLTSFWERNMVYISKLRHTIHEVRPDVVVSFMAEPNYRAILAAAGLGTKTIISVRNDPCQEYAGRMGRLLGQRLLPLADGCVFQTEQARAWFPEKLQKKSIIIPNAVNEAFYSTQRAPIPGMIVTCGRLNAQKNQKMLIDAFSRIAGRYPWIRLRIYGDGDLRQALSQQITDLGLDDRVELMGVTTDVPSVLREASVFVMSSDYEGMPNALMEAMAVGVPCISTDCPCGGPQMLIDNGQNGLLVPVGDTAQLAQALEKLLSDETLAGRMGQQAHQSAQRFLPERIFQEWKAYIDAAIR